MDRQAGTSMTALYRVFRAISWFLMHVIFSLQIQNPLEGAFEGPLIICANHRSYFDIPALIVAYPGQIHFIAKKDFERSWVGPLFRALGVIFVERGTSDIQSMRQVLRGLKDGQKIGIFPEGTRVKTYDPSKLKEGVGFLVQHSRCPVLCANISGDFRFRGRVTLTWRPVMEFSKDNDLGRKEERALISREIFDSIYGRQGSMNFSKTPGKDEEGAKERQKIRDQEGEDGL